MRNDDGQAMRVVRTLRHLRPLQFAWLLRRRLLPRARARVIAAAHLCEGLGGLRFCPVPVPEMARGEIVFVGMGRPFDPAAIDWRAADAPKLWRYNLHYFDYLHWPAWDDVQKKALVEDWIRANPPALGDGWEPYPVSLRVVNWLKWWLAGGPSPGAAVRASLATQVDWLSRNLEHELLANHLLKNAKALLWGGLCLEVPQARRWCNRGLALLQREADEQFLADGGHIERSPMYHAIALEDLLDVINLLDGLGGRGIGVWGATRERLVEHATRALEFYATLCGPRLRLPLFNDAAHGVAPAPAELIAYGHRVLGRETPPPEVENAFAFAASGYWGLHTAGQRLVIDGGPVGPDYQPGHTHCDTLSFELDIDGRPVIVDAGVHDYENGEMRRYVRSTAAHNTLRVDGAEQSEIWGAFRVARRARPRDVAFEVDGPGRIRFHGAHDGYERLAGAPRHVRVLRVDDDRHWCIDDRVEGAGTHQVESFLHFDPRVRLVRAGDATFGVEAPGGVNLRITPSGFDGCRIEKGWHCPAFGRREANAVLIGTTRGELPLNCGFVIERVGREPTR